MNQKKYSDLLRSHLKKELKQRFQHSVIVLNEDEKITRSFSQHALYTTSKATFLVDFTTCIIQDLVGRYPNINTKDRIFIQLMPMIHRREKLLIITYRISDSVILSAL